MTQIASFTTDQTNYWKADMHTRIYLATTKGKLQLEPKQTQKLDLQKRYSHKNLPTRQYIDKVCNKKISTFIDSIKHLF